MTDSAPGGATRRRNSAQSRENLLAAAAELFSERGYEGTTIREVGALAGVDPALIARYFGGKPQLYLASLRRDDASDSSGSSGSSPIDLRDVDRVQKLLERVSRVGVTPSLSAAVRPHEDAELQAAALEVLEERILGPLVASATAGSGDDARLRAEIATAALVGVVLSRTRGAFPQLSGASSGEVARLVTRMIGEVLDA
jgi:AcrR family transcriptional regulator